MSNNSKQNSNPSAQNQMKHPHKYRKGIDSNRYSTEVNKPEDFSHFAVANPVIVTAPTQGQPQQPILTSNSEDEEDDDDQDSDEFEDFNHQHHAAMNLLDIGRSWAKGQQQTESSGLGTLSSAGSAVTNHSHLAAPTGPIVQAGTAPPSINEQLKGDYSITKIYEPKFMQVFHSYCESMKQQIDISKHLMSVCLENLIPFSCWARESNNRCQLIKDALDDNPDLRPEVRNGLSMILIYCLSSAQARQTKDGDMFSVLQDSEKGLGIVNKTSLKIYNDPFNYFSFLKSCMSGLIDAGKIPENERQNQPKKPKRQSENKEEIYAFIQLKNLLVTMLNEGQNIMARAKVTQVMNVWQHRQKNIRNRRFSTALAVVSTLSNLKQKVAPNFLGQSSAIRGFDESGYISSIGYNPAATLLEKQATVGLKSLAAISSEAFEVEGTGSITSPPASSKGSIPGRKSINNPLSLGEVGSIGIDNISHIPAINAICSGPTGYLGTGSTDISGFHAKDLLHDVGSAACNNPSKCRANRSFPCIPALRFERVGGKEWEFKENKVYNIESLVGNINSVFCLLDETKLSLDERKSKRFISHTNGFVSLQAELQHRGALLTSWPKFDHSHMLDFLECWLGQDHDVTLLDFWKMSSVSGNGVATRDHLSTNSSVPQGLGILAYEVIMQVGIVLRKNESLGIKEDCWRLIYPLDLQCETMSTSFGSFLISFFPQLRNILNRLSMEDLKNIIVKYYPHKIEPPVMQPPRNDPTIAYQTIGTLDEHTALVISRFENNLAFHDITLQVS